MGAHKSKHRGTGSKSLEAKKQMLLQNVLAVEKEIKESKQDIQFHCSRKMVVQILVAYY